MTKVLFLLLTLAASAQAGTFVQGGRVKKAGDAMTGPLSIQAQPSLDTSGDVVVGGTLTVNGAIIGITPGHAIQGNGSPAVQRSTLNFVGPGISVQDLGGITTVTISTNAIGQLIRSTSTLVPTATTSAASWTSVPGSTLTLVMVNYNPIRVQFSCNVECVNNSGCGIAFGYLVDGGYADGETASPASGIMYMETHGSNISTPEPLLLDHRGQAPLAPGSHNISLVWASTGAVQARLGVNMLGCSLTYREDPYQIDTSTAVGGTGAPGVTDYGAKSNVQLRALACPIIPCRAQSTTDFDLYTATGTAAGDWRNSRIGTGP